jgi:hypothetical protein
VSARKTLSKKFYVQFVCAFTLQPCYHRDGAPGLEVAGDLKDWAKLYGDALEGSLALLKASFVLAHGAGAPIALAEDVVLSAESLLAAAHLLGGGKSAVRPKAKGSKGGSQGEASPADYLRAFTNASDGAAAQRIARAVGDDVVRAHVMSAAYQGLAQWARTQDPYGHALSLQRRPSADGVACWVSGEYAGAWGGRNASDVLAAARWGVLGDALEEEEAAASAPAVDAVNPAGDAALQHMVQSLQDQMRQMMAMQAQFMEDSKKPPPLSVVEELPPEEKAGKRNQRGRAQQRKGSTF